MDIATSLSLYQIRESYLTIDDFKFSKLFLIASQIEERVTVLFKGCRRYQTGYQTGVEGGAVRLVERIGVDFFLFLSFLLEWV